MHIVDPIAAPIFDKAVSLDLDDDSIQNGTLWGSDETTSIYIQDPSPDVDAAWDHIAADSGPIITISSKEAVRLGRDPAVIVKAPENWGFGNDAYPAQIDVFHEIHCLNMLRKEMVSIDSVHLIHGKADDKTHSTGIITIGPSLVTRRTLITSM